MQRMNIHIAKQGCFSPSVDYITRGAYHAVNK